MLTDENNRDRLEAIAKDIETKHANAVLHIATRLAEARDIFRYLRDEGGFSGWIETRLHYSRSTVYNLLSIYDRFGGEENLSKRLDTFPASILYLLAAPSTPPDVREEIITRAEAGEPVTVAEVKTAIAKRKPEPRPKHPKWDINPAAAALFANEDQVHAFAGVVNLKTVRKFVTFDQQVDLAKQLTEGNIRAVHYQGWVGQWLRQAGKLQGRIDAAERDDFYKQFPGYEIRHEVAKTKSAGREFAASLHKLETLWKKFPHNPFFGELGSTLDYVIGVIRQYRRAAGEHSADEIERKLSKVQEFERKIQTLEITVTEPRRENEELRAGAKQEGGAR